MRTLRDLDKHADKLLLAGRFHEALHAHGILLALQPSNMDARLRVADSLLALGEVQKAAVVYTALARNAAHGGYPLRALVAIKILTTLEPLLGPLLKSLAELYSSESGRLGRGVRVAPADLTALIPDGIELGSPPPLEALTEEAVTLGGEALTVPKGKLPPIALLSELPSHAFEALLGAMSLVRKRPGEVIIAEGKPGESFYVLARGSVVVEKSLSDGGSAHIARLHDGAIFGEMALLSRSPRSATVRAESDCDLLELDRNALAAVSDQVETIALALDKFTRERLVSNLLVTAPLFRPLDRQQRLDLMRRFTAHDIAAGVKVIEEGVEGRGLYMLLSGKVDVTKRDGSQKLMIATLGPGEVFGEIALVNDEPAIASVTAAQQSTVFFLAKEIFERLAQAVPEIDEYARSLGEERAMDTRLLLDAQDDDEELTDDERILI